MKTITLMFALTLIVCKLQAQGNYGVSGCVKDSINEQPIIGVVSNNNTTFTDSSTLYDLTDTKAASNIQVRSNSGKPGGSMDIVVRGRGTIEKTGPLYVVDGVPVGYEFNGNPDDIESISILKDEPSCSIGCRNSNGVIIITTKYCNSRYIKPTWQNGLPQCKYATESQYVASIENMLQAKAMSHNITTKVIVLCSITETGKVDVLMTNIESDFVFNTYLVQQIENGNAWFPARSNNKDVSCMYQFEFDFGANTL